LSARWIRGCIALATAALLAMSLAPAALAVDTLSVTTQFPAIVASPGTRASFTIDVETTPAARVDLSVSGVPTGWTATLRGGGFVVSAVHTDGDEPANVRLDVDVPQGATGSHRLTVTAESEGTTRQLPLDITVQANVEGEVTMTTDVPGQRGASDQTFTFTLNIRNDTEEDLTYTVEGQGPAGWTVEARPTGQSNAASAVAQGNGTAGVSVTVNPAEDAAAGTYPLTVVANVGPHQVSQELTVEITGSYALTLSTPNGVLTSSGNAGSTIEQQLLLTNTGTAPITNVRLAATLPSGWTIDWGESETVASVPPDEPVTVTARLTPSSDAIAGDYSLNFRANGDQADDTEEIRFTVQTSILGAVIGVVLIIAAFGGLWWVFQRYGRR
jgi:uncharacterized repeat protein (TIGR01451 family)